MRWIVACFLALAACDRGPEVPTSAENRDLDDAGRMLDEAPNSLPPLESNAESAPQA